MPETTSKKLIWDAEGERFYEAGVSKGVLFPMTAEGTYGTGVAWNGLTAVNEAPTGAEMTDLYANNHKYLGIRSAEKYEATIEAYTYPDEFMECDGSASIATGVYIGQQTRKSFGFAYQTIIGNDIEQNDFSYKIHLVYGASAAPSSRDHSTVNESPEASTMSWSISSNPVNVTGHKPTSTLEIDASKADKTKLADFEAIIYGSDTEAPRLPLPDEIATLFGTEAVSG